MRQTHHIDETRYQYRASHIINAILQWPTLALIITLSKLVRVEPQMATTRGKEVRKVYYMRDVGSPMLSKK